MSEYIGYGVAGEPYGEIVRAQVAGGQSYWRLDNERSFFEDPMQGGNSGLHHIFCDAEPWQPTITAHIINHGNGEQFHLPLSHAPGSGHIAALEFPMWGIGNIYSLRLEGAASDEVRQMHMPGNVHVSFHLFFEWAPSDAPPAYDSLRDALLGEGEAEQLIQFNPTAALQRQIFADQFVPNSPEFNLTFDESPYLAQRAERLSDGAVRVYYGRLDGAGNWAGYVGFEER